MVQLFDIAQVAFWTLTYLLIILHEIKGRTESDKCYMPFVSGALNFAWEANALVSSGGGYIGHVLWAALDAAILGFNLRRLKRRGRSKFACIYILAIIGCAVGLWVIFRLPNVDGMLISVFSIDIIMAAEYIARAGSVAPHGRIPIAVTKLLGDLFAWLCYARYSVFVAAVGFVVLLLNLFYLSYSLEYVSQRKGERREKRR